MRSDVRIRFKDGPNGAHLRPGHFRPEVGRMLQVAAEEAPPGLLEIVVTEGFRRGAGLHPKDRAFDVRANHIPRVSADLWVERIAERLGGDYDVLAHGSGMSFHIHVEHDPAKYKMPETTRA